MYSKNFILMLLFYAFFVNSEIRAQCKALACDIPISLECTSTTQVDFNNYIHNGLVTEIGGISIENNGDSADIVIGSQTLTFVKTNDNLFSITNSGCGNEGLHNIVYKVCVDGGVESSCDNSTLSMWLWNNNDTPVGATIFTSSNPLRADIGQTRSMTWDYSVTRGFDIYNVTSGSITNVDPWPSSSNLPPTSTVGVSQCEDGAMTWLWPNNTSEWGFRYNSRALDFVMPSGSALSTSGNEFSVSLSDGSFNMVSFNTYVADDVGSLNYIQCNSEWYDLDETVTFDCSTPFDTTINLIANSAISPSSCQAAQNDPSPLNIQYFNGCRVGFDILDANDQSVARPVEFLVDGVKYTLFKNGDLNIKYSTKTSINVNITYSVNNSYHESYRSNPNEYFKNTDFTGAKVNYSTLTLSSTCMDMPCVMSPPASSDSTVCYCGSNDTSFNIGVFEGAIGTTNYTVQYNGNNITTPSTISDVENIIGTDGGVLRVINNDDNSITADITFENKYPKVTDEITIEKCDDLVLNFSNLTIQNGGHLNATYPFLDGITVSNLNSNYSWSVVDPNGQNVTGQTVTLIDGMYRLTFNRNVLPSCTKVLLMNVTTGMGSSLNYSENICGLSFDFQEWLNDNNITLESVSSIVFNGEASSGTTYTLNEGNNVMTFEQATTGCTNNVTLTITGNVNETMTFNTSSCSLEYDALAYLVSLGMSESGITNKFNNGVAWVDEVVLSETDNTTLTFTYSNDDNAFTTNGCDLEGTLIIEYSAIMGSVYNLTECSNPQGETTFDLSNYGNIFYESAENAMSENNPITINGDYALDGSEITLYYVTTTNGCSAVNQLNLGLSTGVFYANMMDLTCNNEYTLNEIASLYSVSQNELSVYSSLSDAVSSQNVLNSIVANGNYIVKITPDDGCPSYSTLSIVFQTNNFTLDDNYTKCVREGDYVNISEITNSGTGVNYSINGTSVTGFVVNDFDSVEVEYTYQASNSCVASGSFTINLNEYESIDPSYTIYVCEKSELGDKLNELSNSFSGNVTFYSSMSSFQQGIPASLNQIDVNSTLIIGVTNNNNCVTTSVVNLFEYEDIEVRNYQVHLCGSGNVLLPNYNQFISSDPEAVSYRYERVDGTVLENQYIVNTSHYLNVFVESEHGCVEQATLSFVVSEIEYELKERYDICAAINDIIDINSLVNTEGNIEFNIGNQMLVSSFGETVVEYEYFLDSNCSKMGSFVLNVNEEIEVNNVVNLYACEENELNAKLVEFKNQYPQYIVKYYLDTEDLNSGVQISNSENLEFGVSLIAIIESLNGSCVKNVAVNLFEADKVELNNSELEICENEGSVYTFDDLFISVVVGSDTTGLSFEVANISNGSIYVPLTDAAYTITVTNQLGCESQAVARISVEEEVGLPENSSISTCIAKGGLVLTSLADGNFQIDGIKSYHRTKEDAENGTNAVTAIQSNATLYVRIVTTKGCVYTNSKVYFNIANEVNLKDVTDFVCKGGVFTLPTQFEVQNNELYPSFISASANWIEQGQGYIQNGNYYTSDMDSIVHFVGTLNGDWGACSAPKVKLRLKIVDLGQLTCNDHLNISVNANCDVRLTADMFHEGINGIPDSFFTIIIKRVVNGVETVIEEDQISNYIGDKNLIYELHSKCSPYNYCWGTVLFENKFSPDFPSCMDMEIECLDTLGNLTFKVPDGDIVRELDNNHYSVMSTCLNYTASFDDSDLITLDCKEGEYAAKFIRTWLFKGNGFTDTCEQTIYIKNSDVDDIKLPADVVLDACQYTLDDITPDRTGYPTYNGVVIDSIFASSLCNVAATYKDIVFPLCGKGKKVQRKWIINIWCSGEIIELYQEIALMDTTAPEFEIDSVFTGSRDNNCKGDMIFYLPVLDNSCGDDKFEIQIKQGFTGNIFHDRQLVRVYNIEGDSTIVNVKAIDQCGNVTNKEVIIRLIDDTSPTVVCEQFRNVTLNSEGYAFVDAIAFDDGSNDNCTSNLIYKVRRLDDGCSNVAGRMMDELDQVKFCCSDVGDVVMVELIVYDSEGNRGTCTSQVNVRDLSNPVISCPSDLTIKCSEFDSTYLNSDIGHLDNCGVVDVEYSFEERINECGIGVVYKSWLVRDRNGNEKRCNQTINIVADPDELSPVIEWPNDTILNCSSEIEEFKYVNEGCVKYDISYSDNIVQSPNSQNGLCAIIQRRYIATSICIDAESISHVQTIQILKSNDDEFEFVDCSQDTTVLVGDCSGRKEFVIDAKNVRSSCDYTLTWIVKNNGYKIASGSGECKIELKTGNYEIHWTAKNLCGDEIHCVEDYVVVPTDEFSITCPDDVSIDAECNGSVLVSIGAPTIDSDCDNDMDITWKLFEGDVLKISGSDAFNFTLNEGVYRLVYMVANKTCELQVTVNSNDSKGEIACDENVYMYTVDCGALAEVKIDEPNVIGDCDVDLLWKLIKNGSEINTGTGNFIENLSKGVYTLVYSGNVVESCEISITVKENPGIYTVNCGELDYTYNISCENSIEVNLDAVIAENSCTNEQVELNWILKSDSINIEGSGSFNRILFVGNYKLELRLNDSLYCEKNISVIKSSVGDIICPTTDTTYVDPGCVDEYYFSVQGAEYSNDCNEIEVISKVFDAFDNEVYTGSENQISVSLMPGVYKTEFLYTRNGNEIARCNKYYIIVKSVVEVECNYRVEQSIACNSSSSLSLQFPQITANGCQINSKKWKLFKDDDLLLEGSDNFNYQFTDAGTYKLSWYINEEPAICNTEIVITSDDNKAPTPKLTPASTSLGSSGSVAVAADLFDYGSSDDCGDVFFKFRTENGLVDSLYYSCSDIENGISQKDTVAVVVLDEAGNSVTIDMELVVGDNANVCEDVAGNGFSLITGIILDNKGNAIQHEFIDTRTGLTFTTNQEGKYETLVHKSDYMIIRPLDRLGFEDLNAIDVEMFNLNSDINVSDINGDGITSEDDRRLLIERVINQSNPVWKVLNHNGSEKLRGGYNVMYLEGDIDKSSNLVSKRYETMEREVHTDRLEGNTMLTFRFEENECLQLDLELDNTILSVSGTGNYSVNNNKMMYINNDKSRVVRVLMKGIYSNYEISNMLDRTKSYVYDRSNDYKRYVLLFSGITDVKDLNSTSLSIYPNPSSGSINISSTENIEIDIIDTNGRIVLSENVVEGENRIDLDLQNGVYFIKFNRSSFGTVIKRLIIVK